MCLYPKYWTNKRYYDRTKGGILKVPSDERKWYIQGKCGNCMECRKEKQREWRIRIMEEYKVDKRAQFVTLTFSEEGLEKAIKEAETIESGAVAAKAVRNFTERWRDKFGKTIKHWLITELGHVNTERLHLHGILWTTEDNDEIEARWGYGKTEVGYSMNQKVVNYVVKYITKEDKDHPGYMGKMLASKKLGYAWLESEEAKRCLRNNDMTYRLPDGRKIKLPDYYIKKLLSWQEREENWMKSMDKEEAYVNKVRIRRVKNQFNDKRVEAARKAGRRLGLELGYGNGEKRKKYKAKFGELI